MKRYLILGVLFLLLIGSASATNLLVNTSEFNATTWAKNYVSVYNDTTTAPDASMDADTLRESAGVSTKYMYQTGSPIISGSNYTSSIYLKLNATSTITIVQMASSSTLFGATKYANFNLSSGAVENSFDGVATMTDEGDGWYKCSWTVTAIGTGDGSIFVLTFTNNDASLGRMPTYNSFAPRYVEAWGASAELGDGGDGGGGALPATDFITNQTATNAPLRAIQFTDNTTEFTPTTWSWSSKDYHITTVAETVFSTEQNPVHTWGAGNFSIMLNAGNGTYSNKTADNGYWLNVSAGNSDKDEWTAGYEFYPADNILRVPVTNMSVHAKSADWLANLTAMSGSYPIVTWQGGLTTETIWVVNTSNVSYQRLYPGTPRTWHDNVDPGAPVPDDMWTNWQSGDSPATLLDFDNKVAYSLAGLSKYANGTWKGSTAVWNWTSNNKRFSAFANGTPNGHTWAGHNYVLSTDTPVDSTALRNETTYIWGGRSMVDLPQWYMMAKYSEVQAGFINHTLYIIVPYAGNASSTLWPASNTGDSGDRSNCIAPGARIRLKSSYDISGFDPQSKVIAQALQTYGGIVGDNGASYGASIYIANDSQNRWDTSDLNDLKTIPLSALEVVDESSLMVSRYTMEVDSYIPTVDFTADETVGLAAPFVVNFTDTSGGTPTSWIWTFDDGESPSYVQNPQRSFWEPGYYTISLTASNSLGSNSTTKADYILLVLGTSDAPVAHFNMSIVTPTPTPTPTATATPTPTPTVSPTIPPGELFGAEPFNSTTSLIGGGGDYYAVVTSGDYTVSTKSELLSALSTATSGETVFVTGTASIDLTGEPAITIPAGVTLASDRGHDGSLGARIYRTTGYGSNTNTFVAGGAGVRLTGIRLEGAWGVEMSTNTWFAGFNSAGYTNTEVDNCDISKWNRGIVHEPGAYSTTTLYAHNNYIHQNNNDGYGYGVAVGGGVVTIERNIFQYNRHSIGASAVAGEEYEARYNIELGGFTSGTAQAGWHNFDAHAISGVSGKKQYIHHNTFVDAPTAAQATPHVDIEGVASVGTYIDHNVFNQTWYPTYEPVYANGGTARFYVTQNYWNGVLYAVDGVVQY